MSAIWTRLDFEEAPPSVVSIERADVALFVGCARRRCSADGRPTALPAALLDWWDRTMGWHEGQRRSGQPRHDREHLLNLPVPLQGWRDFEALFEVGRPVTGRAAAAGPAAGMADAGAEAAEAADAAGWSAPGLSVAAPLAAAVRAFFAAGGRRCYVVRVGDPLPYADPERQRFEGQALLRDDRLPATLPSQPLLLESTQSHAERAAARVSLLPGLQGQGDGVRVGAGSQTATLGLYWAEWQGPEWIYGLPEVSMLMLPDLPEAFAVPVQLPGPERRTGVPPEPFAACVPEASPTPVNQLRRVAAPAVDAAGFRAWRAAVALVLALLRGRSAAVNRRDVQLILALPLPADALAQALGQLPASGMTGQAVDWLRDWLDTGTDADDAEGADLHHAQLQLCWPWLRTARSADLPQELEPPDAAFAGALAAQTVQAGAFRSVALQPAFGVIDTLPRWTSFDADQPVAFVGEGLLRPVQEVLTLCLPRRSGTRGGFEWASDRTTAQDPILRIGAVRRLLAQVMRHARHVGDSFVHEPSNEATWFRLRAALDALGRRIVAAGALDDSEGDGWVVVCDRRTMLDADIDAGRLIAQIALRPALPIERIVVTLTLRDGAPGTLAEAA